MNNLQDTRVDSGRGAAAGNNPHSFGVVGGKREEAIADFFMERQRFAFKAVMHRVFTGSDLASPESFVQVEIQNQGQVRHAAKRGHAMHFTDEHRIETAAASLVDRG